MAATPATPATDVNFPAFDSVLESSLLALLRTMSASDPQREVGDAIQHALRIGLPLGNGKAKLGQDYRTMQ